MWSTGQSSLTENSCSSRRENRMPNMGAKTDPRFYLPKFKLLRRRLKRSSQAPKTFGLDQVEDILTEYDLKLTEPPRLPDVCGRSGTLVVATSGGNFILKRYKASMELPAIVHEHSILNYLAMTDFPAPRLLHTSSGETFIQRQGRVYALTAFLEGYMQYTNYVLFPWQLRPFISAAGEMLAALHQCLRGFVPQGHNPNGFKSLKGDRWRNLDWYTGKLTYCMEQTHNRSRAADSSTAVVGTLLERAVWMHDTLCQLDQVLDAAAPPRLIIHGDYNPNNLLFKPNAPPVVLDLEIARLDWRITDLARSISRFVYGQLGFNSARMKCFLSAYIARYPVSVDELLLSPTVWQFLLLRRVIVCWHHGCTRHSDRWDAEIQHHLKRIDWIVASQDKLIAYLEAISESS
jgi:Ser/Thr protein kinase RdoA (MazF antagonist)